MGKKKSIKKSRRTAKRTKTRKAKPAPRNGAHPPHPKCPACGRALYKSPESAPVKKTDPWAWCRNERCENFSRDLSKACVRGAA